MTAPAHEMLACPACAASRRPICAVCGRLASARLSDAEDAAWAELTAGWESPGGTPGIPPRVLPEHPPLNQEGAR